MNKRTRRIMGKRACWWFCYATAAVAMLVAGPGCLGGSTGHESVTGQPLSPCAVSDECNPGLDCVCSVCTNACVSDNACGDLGADLKCMATTSMSGCSTADVISVDRACFPSGSTRMRPGEQDGGGGSGSGGRAAGSGGADAGDAGDAPPAGKCADHGLDRSCAVDADCAVARVDIECCGAALITGIARSELEGGAYADFQAACAYAGPPCDCAAFQVITDDGTVQTGPVAVSCVAGTCSSTANPKVDPSEGICTVGCTGAAPSEQVVSGCIAITDQTACTAYMSMEFPYRCVWQVGTPEPCLAP